ncbi:MAG: hypothetical protein KDK11_10325 [Maritimibacter sp.]|nr:hypothetical protein [Maritimibacter sp.]
MTSFEFSHSVRGAYLSAIILAPSYASAETIAGICAAQTDRDVEENCRLPDDGTTADDWRGAWTLTALDDDTAADLLDRHPQAASSNAPFGRATDLAPDLVEAEARLWILDTGLEG